MLSWGASGTAPLPHQQRRRWRDARAAPGLPAAAAMHSAGGQPPRAAGAAQDTHVPMLQPPPDLVRASAPSELEALMPSSYPIARFRRRSIEARGIRVSYKPHHAGEVLGAPLSCSGDAPLPPRALSDSYLQVILPFASSPNLRDEYERFQMGRVRLGLVLEDIDSFAADVAARHLAGLEGFAVITAAMDRLTLVTHEQHLQQVRQGLLSGGGGGGGDGGSSGAEQDVGSAEAAALRPPLDAAGRQELQRAVVEAPAGSEASSGGPLLIDNDLRLAGCVAWVGRSSLEVVIELADRPPPADGSASPTNDADGRGWRRRGVAHFVMVVKSTRPGVPLRLYPLAPATPQEEELCRQAAARQEERRVRRATEVATEGAPPSVAGPDALLLQALVSRAAQQRAEEWRHHLSSGGGAAGAARAAVPMGATLLRAPIIMHHQDRNITDAIFGGHILRSAYEAAYATAALHAGAHPEPLSMSDITFKQPVTVGSIVEFEAKVVLTHGELMRVSVAAIKHEPAMGAGCAGGAPVPRPDQALTTTFSFLFAAPLGSDVAPVRPDTLADAADWLLAARQHADDGYPRPPLEWGSSGNIGSNGGPAAPRAVR
ncbi:hypothetical protein Rsub_10275 [Raphidocelis subcapitata]|uniref:HotDog ACOT-type domain-containing protein n=1 Tax=Raphidocelis subcapitata TaxID=307507 RepID=A0A2V0PL42_9CHLO|nr:hypothetical protein Rsub_10275 [Raphidocelis subcapitata]|eukprot:GBF98047.1 hypothetical protein Rsub_10275 [Raphidocelis subcapitata]